jgi:hypothetical protein
MDDGNQEEGSPDQNGMDMNGVGMSDDMEEIDYKICGELGKKNRQRLFII